MCEKYCSRINWECLCFNETTGACYGSGCCEYDYWLEFESWQKSVEQEYEFEYWQKLEEQEYYDN